MPYPKGGRADKYGNRFEYNWVINKVLDIIEEKIEYIIIEILGDEEEGVDLWVGNKDGTKEAQQCKGRAANKEYWTYGSANERGIFDKWLKHLTSNDKNQVSLVSPLSFTILEDLITLSRTLPDDYREFYYQINSKTHNDSKKMLENLSNKMNLHNLDDEKEAKLMIEYLSRMNYRQWPDSEAKNIILNKINYLFSTDPEVVYSMILNFCISENIFGHRIDFKRLEIYFTSNNIHLRNLHNDKRIKPSIAHLNEEYKASFTCLRDGLIVRDEMKECEQLLNQEKSIVIHGKAGIGKSGLTENIIMFCEENLDYEYLAIKLDEKIPSINPQRWGEEIGLQASPVQCLNAIARDKKGVLILDQLDALRWTQAHSKNSINVCVNLINELKEININRKHKISLVLICRTYDLENDSNIKKLFSNDDSLINFERIQVNELHDDIVKLNVGDTYVNLSKKQKELLRVPNNLYIWQQLNPNGNYNQVLTTQQLINEWWNQLETSAYNNNLNIEALNKCKERIVDYCNKKGRINIPLVIIRTSNVYIDFMQSNGILKVINNNASFVHQSILDCFLAEQMFIELYSGKSIEEIIGPLEMQTLSKRYQVQLLLQQLLESSEEDFIKTGEKILSSNEIRFNIKYVVLELLSQKDKIGEPTIEFIIRYIDDKEWKKHIYECVLLGRKVYLDLLISTGIIEKWLEDPNEREKCIVLIERSSPNYSHKAIEIIKNNYLKFEYEKDLWFRCFGFDLHEDSDLLFELRLEFYKKYPKYSDYYVNFKQLMKECSLRSIRYLKLLLELKQSEKKRKLYQVEEEYVLEDSDIILNSYEEVIKELLPIIPTTMETCNMNWNRRFQKYSIERTCVQIFKKATRRLAHNNPQEFFKIYNNYIGTGLDLHNEIILDALYYLPDCFADDVIKIVSKDLNILYEETSGNKDSLLLGKRLIKRFIELCDRELYLLIEDKIVHYIAPNAHEVLNYRLRMCREEGRRTFIDFWGDLQKELLESIPNSIMSIEAQNLLSVLQRSYKNKTTSNYYSIGHSGTVYSPVTGKDISPSCWKHIILNEKIATRKEKKRWKEVKGGFIESSLEQFSQSFGNAVRKNPNEMCQMLLSITNDVNPIYIESFYSALAYSDLLNDVDNKTIEKIFAKYEYNLNERYCLWMCEIIENKDDTNWSNDVHNMLIDIALNYKNSELDEQIINNFNKENKTINGLTSICFNLPNTNAIKAITHLLWYERSLYKKFKFAIEELVKDECIITRFALMSLLQPLLYINEEWAAKQIVSYAKNEILLCGAITNIKNIFITLFDEYEIEISEILIECFNSSNSQLIKIGGYAIAEIYLMKGKFKKIVDNGSTMNEKQTKAILDMLIVYFQKDNYNAICKDIIITLIDNDYDLEYPLYKLFDKGLVKIERDKEFIDKLLLSKSSKKVLSSFVSFLEDNQESIVEYSEIIISMCISLIEKDYSQYYELHHIGNEISTLIICLFDAVSEGKTSQEKLVARNCLDLWDKMYETKIGIARLLTTKIMSEM